MSLVGGILRALVLALAATLLVAPNASAGPTSVLYAAPRGTGTKCTSADPCSLTTAQSKVRALTPTMTGDITVVLGGGTYRLASTFSLTESANDGGRNGYTVSYVAAEGAAPVLSGAKRVTGWRAVPGSPLVRAGVGTGVKTRQFYVDGVRQPRATQSPGLPGTVTKTSTGYTTTSSAPLAWSNVSGIEFVYRLGPIEQRCPLSSIGAAAGQTVITMASPCWQAATDPNRPGGVGYTVGLPSAVENARQLIDSPGEWYLDPSGWLYYWPPSGADLSTSELPVLERLVSASGTTARPLQNLRLSGLTFTHATWLAPSSGFSEIQANTYWSDRQTLRPLANVVIASVRNVTIENNVFTQLGGVGLAVERGAQFVVVDGNRFSDISSNGAQIGSWLPPAEETEAQDRRLTFSNNTITDAATEFHGGVGLLVGIVADSVITQNTLHDLPYTAISYGYHGTSYQGGNQVTGNRIEDVVKLMWDGGAIYTLGSSPNTQISGNYVARVYHNMAGLYLDAQSARLSVTDNVIQQSGWDWLYLQLDAPMCACVAVDNRVERNFSDGSQINGLSNGRYDPSNIVENNQTGLTVYPAEAWAIINAAGAR